MASLLNAYVRVSISRPLTTKAVTCAVGFALGDGVAQLLSGKGRIQKRLRQIDLYRTLRLSAYGAFVAAPQLHLFLTWMDRVR